MSGYCFFGNNSHELRLLHLLKGKIIKWECSCGKTGDDKKTWKGHIEKVTKPVLERA